LGRAIVKDVAQMTSALRTQDLGALTKERAIYTLDDRARFARVKTWPPATRVKFLRAGEEALSAPTASKDTLVVYV
jgi:hypothetical protein